MLIGSLYTINDLQTRENDTLFAKIVINKEHPVLKGHFPNHPVMPGVCLTNMITDIVSTFQDEEHYLFSADFIKFIQLVLPEKVNSVLATIKIISRENEMIRIEASLSDVNTTYFKLKGNFKPIN